MSDEPTTGPESGDDEPDGGVADALRTAVERTMRATAGSAVSTRDLVDEVVRRGRDARDELARRGQEAGVGLARRGQEATGEIGRRVEMLERRLAELEGRLIPEDGATQPEAPPDPSVKDDADPEAEG